VLCAHKKVIHTAKNFPDQLFFPIIFGKKEIFFNFFLKILKGKK